MCKSTTTTWHVQVVHDAGYISEVVYRYYIMSFESINALYGEVDRVKKGVKEIYRLTFQHDKFGHAFLIGISFLCKQV